MKCGEYTAAAGAFAKAVHLSGGKCVHVEVLEGLLSEVRRLRAPPAADAADPAGAAADAPPEAAECADEEEEEEEEGDAAMGDEAARFLDMFDGMSIGIDVGAGRGSGGGGARAHDDEEGRIRRRGMLVRPTSAYTCVPAASGAGHCLCMHATHASLCCCCHWVCSYGKTPPARRSGRPAHCQVCWRAPGKKRRKRHDAACRKGCDRDTARDAPRCGPRGGCLTVTGVGAA